MDWDKHGGLGTGKIAVAVFKEPHRGWVKDIADPLSQAGRSGNWLRKQGKVKVSSVRAVVPVTSAMIRKATKGR